MKRSFQGGICSNRSMETISRGGLRSGLGSYSSFSRPQTTNNSRVNGVSDPKQVMSPKSLIKKLGGDIQFIDHENKLVHFAVTSIQGRRDQNEDAHAIFEVHGLQVVALCDGHNGDQVSKMLVKLLQPQITKMMDQRIQDKQQQDPASVTSSPSVSICRIIDIKQIMLDVIEHINDAITQIIDLSEVGTTLILTIVDMITDKIHVCNVGDSRFQIGYADSTFQTTRDHKPGDPIERERIEKAGGKVVTVDGVDRVNGILAVARSVGDKYLKEFVSCEPDYYEFDLTNASYVLLACDGLFDVFTSNDVNDILQQIHKKRITDKQLFQIMTGQKDVNQELCRTTGKMKLLYENVEPGNSLAKRTSQALTKMAYLRGSSDNVSACVSYIDHLHADTRLDSIIE